MNSNAPESAPVVRRKRPLLRLFVVIVLLIAVLVLLLPAAATGMAKRRLGEELTRELGTPCRVDDLSLSWFSGASVGAIEIDNPDGFDRGHPLLRIQSARADISLLRLLRGQVDVEAELRGLRLWIDQDAAGATNLEHVLAAAGVAVAADAGRTRTTTRDRRNRNDRDTDRGREDGTTSELLARLRLNLALLDSGIEIRRNGQLLESVDDLRCVVLKQPGSDQFQLKLEAKLPALTAAGRNGSLYCSTDFDGARGSAKGSLRASHLDLGRYEPLVQSLLAPGDLEAMTGVVDGAVEFRFDPRQQPRLVTTGDLTVAEPHFAGALLHGLDLAAERWVLKPGVQLSDDAVDASATQLDFGFVQLHGLAADARAEHGLGDDLACAFTLDLAGLARLGGPLQDLAGATGTVTGTVALPKALLTGDVDAALAALQQLRGIAVDAQLSGMGYGVAGLQLANGGARASLRDGALQLESDPSTTLNAGPLQLSLQTSAGDDMPFELRLGWNGGRVDGSSASVLRYALPLLAGLDAEAPAFDSAVGMQLVLRGPLRPRTGESRLAWLDRFEGNGSLDFTDGSIRPAKGLSGLLELLGQQQRLAIDRLTGTFTMQQGAITTKAMKWLSKGREYGLSGVVHLDGALEFGLDVTALLQQHKDGRAIAAFLKDTPLRAGLGGTLAAPTLAAPDLGALLRQAVEQAPKQLLEQQGKDLLQKGLDQLLRGRKKDDPGGGR